MWTCKVTSMIFSVSVLVQVYESSIRLETLYIKQLKHIQFDRKATQEESIKKSVLVLFTVWSLTVQVFLEMFNRTNVY